MKKILLPLLAALVAGLPLHATPTNPVYPDVQTFKNSMQAYLHASPPNTSAVITACTSAITGNYAPANAADADQMNNAALWFMGEAKELTLGVHSAHDYYVSVQYYEAAAHESAKMYSYAQAVTEQEEAITADAVNIDANDSSVRAATLILYKVQAGQATNTDVSVALSAVTVTPLPLDAAKAYYNSYNRLGSAPAVATTFYHSLKAAVNANDPNAATFRGTVTDTINNLAQ